MIERVRAGLVTAIVAAAAFGALAAPVAEAATGPAAAGNGGPAAAGDGGPTGKPKTDCIWLWTVKGPVCHWQ